MRIERDNTDVIDAFVPVVAECIVLLHEIETVVDDHFEVGPDDVTWGHVANARRTQNALRDIRDRLYGLGEYAAGGFGAVIPLRIVALNPLLIACAWVAAGRDSATVPEDDDDGYDPYDDGDGGLDGPTEPPAREPVPIYPPEDLIV